MKRLSWIRILCKSNICLVFSECCSDGRKTFKSLAKKPPLFSGNSLILVISPSVGSASRDLVNSVINF